MLMMLAGVSLVVGGAAAAADDTRRCVACGGLIE